MKVGDVVTRNLCGVKMHLKITEIDGRFVHCGPWKFDKKTGAEVDEDLGWDNGYTGSFLEELK